MWSYVKIVKIDLAPERKVTEGKVLTLNIYTFVYYFIYTDLVFKNFHYTVNISIYVEITCNQQSSVVKLFMLNVGKFVHTSIHVHIWAMS